MVLHIDVVFGEIELAGMLVEFICDLNNKPHLKN